MNVKTFKTETGLGYNIEIPSVFRSYKILKDLNKGAYSSVVQVEDQYSNEIYAAKIIPKLSIENKSQLHLINKEIDILSKLSHKNIVKLFSTIELANKKGEEFFILIEEFCHNGSLLNYVNTIGFKNKKEVRMISRGITEAVKYLHDEKIAHCDIKPENILLTKDNVPKLCDFNLSKFIANADQTDRSCTLAYSAPEIHIFKPIDFIKADIWSLGITLFAISELRLPYRSIEEALRGKLRYSTVSKLLDSFTKKCLNFDPSKRLSSSQLLSDPYLTIDENFVDDYDYDLNIIMKSKEDSAVDHVTSPKLNRFQKVVVKQTANADKYGNDKHKSDDYYVMNLSITLELGFDFSFSIQNDADDDNINNNKNDDDDDDDVTSQNARQAINDYLDFNYSEFLNIENNEHYEIERIEDRICDNLLRVKYQKKNKTKKDKKKGKKTKYDKRQLSDNYDNDDDE